MSRQAAPTRTPSLQLPTQSARAKAKLGAINGSPAVGVRAVTGTKTAHNASSPATPKNREAKPRNLGTRHTTVQRSRHRKLPATTRVTRPSQLSSLKVRMVAKSASARTVKAAHFACATRQRRLSRLFP
eukprot:1946428-Pleurochrysis_carterae.AAC.1